jgi:signal peptidase I
MNPGPDPSQPDPAAAPAPTGAAVASERPRRGPSWLLVLAVALLVMALVRGFLVQSFYVPSGSMEPTIVPGDRILVNKLVDGSSLQRGDVVVFDGTTTFAAAERKPHEDKGIIGRVLAGAASLLGVQLGEEDFVKRVIGLPGDHVVCCAPDGRLEVNGTPVSEPYLQPGDKPSELTFDISVPAGRLWVMGDHRGDSADSRSHLGDPGGGTVSVDDVVGRTVARYWPLNRVGGFGTPHDLADIPRVATR